MEKGNKNGRKIIIKKKIQEKKRNQTKKKEKSEEDISESFIFLVGCMGGLYFEKEEFIQE